MVCHKRRKREEGRRKKEEGRGKREEGRGKRENLAVSTNGSDRYCYKSIVLLVNLNLNELAMGIGSWYV
jgi:hypothetical protein